MSKTRIRAICLTVGVAAGLTLAGCSSPATDAVDEASPSSKDRTSEFVDANSGASWASQVTSAEETEPGRLVVATTIVDPRSAASAEAQSAIAVCEAAVQLLGADVAAVSVSEADGTTFVLYGHPSAPAGTCAVV